MPDLSCTCDLHCTLWQHWIFNSLSEARDQTHILMDISQVPNPLSHNGNSRASLLEGSGCGIHTRSRNRDRLMQEKGQPWYPGCWSCRYILTNVSATHGVSWASTAKSPVPKPSCVCDPCNLMRALKTTSLGCSRLDLLQSGKTEGNEDFKQWNILEAPRDLLLPRWTGDIIWTTKKDTQTKT